MFLSVASLCLLLHLLKPAFLVLLTNISSRGVLSPFRALSVQGSLHSGLSPFRVFAAQVLKRRDAITAEYIYLNHSTASHITHNIARLVVFGVQKSKWSSIEKP